MQDIDYDMHLNGMFCWIRMLPMNSALISAKNQSALKCSPLPNSFAPNNDSLLIFLALQTRILFVNITRELQMCFVCKNVFFDEIHHPLLKNNLSNFQTVDDAALIEFNMASNCYERCRVDVDSFTITLHKLMNKLNSFFFLLILFCLSRRLTYHIGNNQVFNSSQSKFNRIAAYFVNV